MAEVTGSSPVSSTGSSVSPPPRARLRPGCTQRRPGARSFAPIDRSGDRFVVHDDQSASLRAPIGGSTRQRHEADDPERTCPTCQFLATNFQLVIVPIIRLTVLSPSHKSSPVRYFFRFTTPPNAVTTNVAAVTCAPIAHRNRMTRAGLHLRAAHRPDAGNSAPRPAAPPLAAGFRTIEMLLKETENISILGSRASPQGPDSTAPGGGILRRHIRVGAPSGSGPREGKSRYDKIVAIVISL